MLNSEKILGEIIENNQKIKESMESKRCRKELEDSIGTYRKGIKRELRVRKEVNVKYTSEVISPIEKRYNYNEENIRIYNEKYLTEGLSTLNLPSKIDPFIIPNSKELKLEDFGEIYHKNGIRYMNFNSKREEILNSIGFLPESRVVCMLTTIRRKNKNYGKIIYEESTDGMVPTGVDENKYIWERAYYFTETNKNRNVKYHKNFVKLGYGVPLNCKIYDENMKEVTILPKLPIYKSVECKVKRIRKQGELVVVGLEDIKEGKASQIPVDFGDTIDKPNNVMNQGQLYYGKSSYLILDKQIEISYLEMQILAQYGITYDGKAFNEYMKKLEEFKENKKAGKYEDPKECEKAMRILKEYRDDCSYSARDFSNRNYKHFGLAGTLDPDKEITVSIKEYNDQGEEVLKVVTVATEVAIKAHNDKLEELINTPDLTNSSREKLEKCKMSLNISDEWFTQSRRILWEPLRFNRRETAVILADVDLDDTLASAMKIQTLNAMLKNVDYTIVANKYSIVKDGKLVDNEKRHHYSLIFPLYELRDRKQCDQVMNILKLIVSDINFKNHIAKNILNPEKFRIIEHKAGKTLLETLKEDNDSFTQFVKEILEYYNKAFSLGFKLNSELLLENGNKIYEIISSHARELRNKTKEKFHGPRIDEFKFFHEFYYKNFGIMPHKHYEMYYKELYFMEERRELEYKPSFLLREQKLHIRKKNIDYKSVEEFDLENTSMYSYEKLYTLLGERRKMRNIISSDNTGVVDLMDRMWGIRTRTISLNRFVIEPILITSGRRDCIKGIAGSIGRNYNYVGTEDDVVEFFFKQIKKGKIIIRNDDNRYTKSKIQKEIREEFRRGRLYLKTMGLTLRKTGYNAVQAWFGGWVITCRNIQSKLKLICNLQEFCTSKKTKKKYKTICELIKSYYNNEIKIDELYNKFIGEIYNLICLPQLEKVNNSDRYTEDEKKTIRKIITDELNLITSFNFNIIRKNKEKINEKRAKVIIKKMCEKSRKEIKTKIAFVFDVVNKIGNVIEMDKNYNYISDLVVAN